MWLVFGHMNGASHGIIAHVYLVNNCGLYLKERTSRWRHHTWDYYPCLLSQQLWLIFERKKKMVHVLHIGGGIWDCNSYVPTNRLL